MSSRPLPRDINAKLTRTERRIVDAARSCFETNGISKTRLEEVAARANVSRQTIYKYFLNKQDIVDQIGFLEMVKINAILREVMSGEADFADRLTMAIVESAQIALQNTYIRKAVEDIDMLPGFPGGNERILDWQREKWRPMMERATAAGDIASDLDFEALLQWIILCQLLLMLCHSRLSAAGIEIPSFVRRFMVEPVMGRGRPADAEAAGGSDAVIAKLRHENAMLRALVSEQALDLYRAKSAR